MTGGGRESKEAKVVGRTETGLGGKQGVRKMGREKPLRADQEKEQPDRRKADNRHVEFLS